MTRCACGNRLGAGQRTCTACQLVASITGIYATVAARQVGLRERIKARWPSYDTVGRWDETAANSPDGLAAHVEIERGSHDQLTLCERHQRLHHDE